MMTEPLRIDAVADAGRTVIRVCGELDMNTGPDLEAAIAAHRGDGGVVVDLAEVRFMDSTGLRVLLTAAATLGPRLWVVPGPPAVQRVFEVTHTTDRIPFAGPLDARPALGEEHFG